MSNGLPIFKSTPQVSESSVALPENDKGNPVSTGNGGIAASLKIKNAGSHDAPGLEKNVNLS